MGLRSILLAFLTFGGAHAWASDPLCSSVLTASVSPGPTPVVHVIGNLNAATPQNPSGGMGYADPAFVPDASVDFSVADSLGTVHQLRIAFEQTSLVPAAPNAWSYYVVDVTGGQTPNGSAWSASGPGNLVATGASIYFNTSGGLQSNSNAGADIVLSIPLVNGATTPFNILLNLGTDATADPAHVGLADGLNGRWCTGGTPTYTPTPVPVATSCAQGPYATAINLSTVALLGNLNACTPLNPQFGQSGIRADAAVDFRVFDSLGAPYDLRLSLEQGADTANGDQAEWYYHLNDVSGGQVPNEQAWVSGGAGNLIGFGGPILFNADGSLQDNSNGGSDLVFGIPTTNGADYPFYFYLSLGTDDARAGASGPAHGLRDGLTGDSCCVPTATPTPTVTATITPTFVAGCMTTPQAPGCLCPAVYIPVCGCDYHTYGNSCEAWCAGVTIVANGACGSTATPTQTPTSTGSLTASDTPTRTDTSTPGGPTATATPTDTPGGPAATATSTPTLTFTSTALPATSVPSSTPLPVPPSSAVLPAANPSAPDAAHPLILYYGIGTASYPAPQLFIVSVSGATIAVLPCVVCTGPTLSFSWDGSGVANGLYYAAVDLGGGKLTGHVPLMVAH